MTAPPPADASTVWLASSSCIFWMRTCSWRIISLFIMGLRPPGRRLTSIIQRVSLRLFGTSVWLTAEGARGEVDDRVVEQVGAASACDGAAQR